MVLNKPRWGSRKKEERSLTGSSGDKAASCPVMSQRRELFGAAGGGEVVSSLSL